MEGNPELAAEQAHVDRAYRRLDELRAQTQELLASVLSQGRGGTPQFREERDVMVRTSLARLEQLDVGDEALCFGRIDRLAEGDGHDRQGEPSVESFHIGRLGVSSEDLEPLVVDWRAPVAEPFYRATGRDPMGLVLRRHLAASGRQLTGLEDERFVPAGARAPGGVAGAEMGTGPQVAATVEEDGLDQDRGLENEIGGPGALLAAISSVRSGRMRDIVSTIQREQDEIIRAPLAGVLVVQGGPGTGKTAVALHRAAYLLYTHRFPLERQGVLVIGPNPLFLRYIEHVLPSLGESGVTLSTASGLVHGIEARSEEPAALARLKGDVRMATVVARAVRSRQRPLRRDVRIPFGSVSLRVSAEESASIISSARRRPGTHNSRRRFVEQMLIRRLGGQYVRTLGVHSTISTGSGVATGTRAKMGPQTPAGSRAGAGESPAGAAEGLAGSDRGVEGARGVADAGGNHWGLPGGYAPGSASGASGGSRESRPGPGVVDGDALEGLPGLSRPSASRSDGQPRNFSESGYEENGHGSSDAAGGPSAHFDLSDFARALRQVPQFPEMLDRIWPRLSAEELLHDLFGARPLVSLAANGLLSAREQMALYRRRSASLAEIPWTEADLALIDEARVLLGPRRPRSANGASEHEEGLRTYGHIVVDEAQDLSPMQLRMITRRSLSGSVTAVGDIAQATGPWAPSAWEEVTAHLPANRPPRTAGLTVSYRTPAEVVEVAGRVLAQAAPGLSPPIAVRRTGVPPSFDAVGAGELAYGVARAAVELVEQVSPGTTAVLAPASMVAELTSALDVAGVHGSDPRRAGLGTPLSLLPVDLANGLEFDAVVVVEPAAIVEESAQGLRALYMTLTRPTRRLAVVHSRALPVALNG